MNTVPSPFTRPDEAASDALLQSALRGCAHRQLPSLRRLHDATAAQLFAQLLQMLGDPREARQALEEGYLHIWQSAAGYLPQHCPPRDWLRGMMRQVAIDRLRGRRQRTAAATEAEILWAMVDGTGPGDAGAIEVMPDGLDDTLLRRLRLAYLSGATERQLAAVLGESPLVLRAQLRQSLCALRGGEPASDELVTARHVLGVQPARVRRRHATRLRSDPAARRLQLQWEARLALLAMDPPPVRPPDQLWPDLEARLTDHSATGGAGRPARWLWISALLAAALVTWLWMRVT